MAQDAIKFSVGADNRNFVSVMRQTRALGNRVALGIGRSLGNLAKNGGVQLAGLAAAAFSTAAVFGGLKKAFDLGGSLSDLSSQTGVAVRDLVVLQQAFANNGLSAEQVGPVINKLQRAIVEGGQGVATYARAFQALGLNLEDLQRLNPAQQFAEVQRAISGIQNPTQRAAVAMQIFGRSGGKLLTLFADSNGLVNAMREMGTQAQILDRQANVFDNISDKLANMVPAKLQGVFVGLADSFAGPITALLQRIESVDFAPLGQRLGATINGVLQQFINFFANPGASLEAFGNALLSQVLNVGNELISGFTFAGNVLGNFFQNLVALGPEQLGNALRDALLRAAAQFQTALLQAGMSLAIELSNFAPLRESALAAFDGLDAALTKHLEASKTIGDSYQNITAAWENAVATTPRILKDFLGADAAAQRAASALARAQQSGKQLFNATAPVPAGASAGSASAATAPRPALNMGPARGNFFNNATRGFAQFFGDQGRLGQFSIGAKGLASPTGKGGSGYAGSYGLIRRGDAARRRAEEAAKKNDPNSLTTTNKLLENQNRLLEENLTVE